MFDLDEILDEVREKYYKSIILERPNIKWSKEYWTGIYGKYTSHDNTIQISKMLSEDNIPREWVEAIAFHESIHQDFKNHDEQFMDKALRYPKYNDIIDQINDYANIVHGNRYNEKIIKDVITGKENVIYILLNNKEYNDLFTWFDEKVYVDFSIMPTKEMMKNQDKTLFVFFFELEGTYFIVGFCTQGELLKKPNCIINSQLGFWDIKYQLITNRENLFIIPFENVLYAISPELLPENFITKKYCVFDIANKEIRPDLEYLQTYDEGFEEYGFDVEALDAIPKFSVSAKTNDICKLYSNGFRALFAANYFYNKDKTIKNLIKVIYARYDIGLITSAYNLAMSTYQEYPNNKDLIRLVFITSAVLRKAEFCKSILKEANFDVDKNDKDLVDAIDYIKKCE